MLGYSVRSVCAWFLILGGCSLSQPNPAPVVEARITENVAVIGSLADEILDTGLKQYEQAQYKRAASTLQQAIDSGLGANGKLIAHKHLAFMHCIANRVSQCRREFGNALALDPHFELTPAEAGHPQWGPVFRSVKANPPATP